MISRIKSALGCLVKSILLLVLVVALATCSAHHSTVEQSRVISKVRQLPSFSVVSIDTLTKEQVLDAVKDLPRSGTLHGKGNYFYIPVDQRYISILYPQLKQSEKWTGCFHKPTDSNGKAHMSVHAGGHGKVRKTELKLLRKLVSNQQRLSFTVAKDHPIEKFIVPKHHHHQINTWYVLRVNPNFDSLRKEYSSKQQRAALKQIEQYRFHISIAVQKKRHGKCVRAH
jgi:hypothetical protein